MDSPPELRFALRGHTGGVNAVVCVDGVLFTASDDGMIIVWEAKTGRRVRELRGHDGPVLCLCEGPEGVIFSGGADSNIIMWNADAGLLAALSQDGMSGSVFLPGSMVSMLAMHRKDVTCMVMDDKHLYSGSADCTIRQWDIDLMQQTLLFTGHTSVVNALSQANGIVISADTSGCVRLWMAANAAPLRDFKSVGSPAVHAACFGGLGTVGFANGQVSTYRLRIKDFDGSMNLDGDLKCLHAAEGVLFAGLADGTVICFSHESKSSEVVIEGEGKTVTSLFCNRKLLFIGYADKSVRVFNMFDHHWEALSVLNSGTISRTATHGSDRGVILQFSTGGDGLLSLSLGRDILFTALEDGTVRGWQVTNNPACVQTSRAHDGPVTSVLCTTNGHLTASVDGTVRLWDPDTGKMLDESTGDGTYAVTTICQHSHYVCVAQTDNRIGVFDISTRRLIAAGMLAGHTGPVRCIASDGSARLISGSDDGTTRLWSVERLVCAQMLDGLETTVTSVAKGASNLFAGGMTGEIISYSSQQWQINGRAPAHEGAVTSLLALDEAMVSAGEDGVIRVWTQQLSRVYSSQPLGIGPICGMIRRSSLLLIGGEDGVVSALALTASALRAASGTQAEDDMGMYGSLLAEYGQQHGALPGAAGPGGVKANLTVSGDRHLEAMKAALADSGSTVAKTDIQSMIESKLSSIRKKHNPNADLAEYEQAGNAAAGSLLTHVPTKSAVTCICIVGELVCAGTMEGYVIIWDPSSDTVLWQLEAHEGQTLSLCAHDSDIVVSGGSDNCVRFWDVATGERVQKFSFVNSVNCVASFESLLFVVPSSETVNVLSLASGKESYRLEGHQGRVSCIASSLTCKVIVTGATDGTIRTWKAPDFRCSSIMSDFEGGITALVVPATPEIFAASEDGTIRRYEIGSGTCLHIWGVPKSCMISCLAVCGTHIFCNWKGHSIVALDMMKGKKANTFEGHDGGTTCLAVMHGILVSGGRDASIRNWLTAFVSAEDHLQSIHGDRKYSANSVADDASTVSTTSSRKHLDNGAENGAAGPIQPHTKGLQVPFNGKKRGGKSALGLLRSRSKVTELSVDVRRGVGNQTKDSNHSAVFHTPQRTIPTMASSSDSASVLQQQALNAVEAEISRRMSALKGSPFTPHGHSLSAIKPSASLAPSALSVQTPAMNSGQEEPSSLDFKLRKRALDAVRQKWAAIEDPVARAKSYLEVMSQTQATYSTNRTSDVVESTDATADPVSKEDTENSYLNGQENGRDDYSHSTAASKKLGFGLPKRASRLSNLKRSTSPVNVQSSNISFQQEAVITSSDENNVDQPLAENQMHDPSGLQSRMLARQQLLDSHSNSMKDRSLSPDSELRKQDHSQPFGQGSETETTPSSSTLEERMSRRRNYQQPSESPSRQNAADENSETKNASAIQNNNTEVQKPANQQLSMRERMALKKAGQAAGEGASGSADQGGTSAESAAAGSGASQSVGEAGADGTPTTGKKLSMRERMALRKALKGTG